MSRLACAAALAVTVPLTACFHVQLGAPARGAPLAERAAAYQQLRKSGEVHTITVSTGKHGTSVNHELDLVLASGASVRHADDLLPVVADDSAAARAARRSGEARANKWLWMIAGTAAGVVGTAVMYQGFQDNLDGIDNDTDPDAGDGKIKLGLGVALIGSLAGTIGGLYYQSVERRERAAAFATYDDGLRARLELCVDGMQLVDCAAAPGAATVEAAVSRPR